MCQGIDIDKFKNEITDRRVSYIVHIYVNMCKQMTVILWLLQCNLDIRGPDIRAISSGPKLEPVLPKQYMPNPDIKYITGPDNSLIYWLHSI